MTGIANRNQLFINFLRISVFIVAIYFLIGYTSRKDFHEVQKQQFLGTEYHQEVQAKCGVDNETVIELDKFVCLVNYTCVYSAYYDDITENKQLIRIVGIDNPKTSWSLLQCFYFDSQRKLMGLPYPAKRVNSLYYYNNATENSSLFFLCDLDIKNEGRPTFVFLSVNGTRPSKEELQKQMLRIHYPHMLEKYRYKVAACVQPFHSGFDNALQVMEWVEYLRLIGVEHFTFYNYTGGLAVSALLNSYGPELVTVLPWNLPEAKGTHIWGQCGAAADCAHRHRGVAKYVLAFDTDEFPIVPVRNVNVYEYLEKMWKVYEQRRGMEINSIQFNSKFSFKNWQVNSSLVPLSTTGLQNLRRVLENLNIPWRSNFLPGGQTKFVYKPDYVEESGIHWVDKGVNGTTWVRPPVDEAHYFHFRECSSYFTTPNQILLNNATCNQSTEIETDLYPAQSFGSKVMDAVANRIYSFVVLSNLFTVGS